ncbi:MAG: SIS domain-containing protein [Planctomycetota bacterium]
MSSFDADFVTARLERSASVIAGVREQAQAIVTVAETIRSALDAGGTIYTCGNGGSAAEAMHLAEELIGRYKLDRPPRAGVCLCADSTAITCIANDFTFDRVFARQIDALGRSGDVLVALSTSGRSRNITLALEMARVRGVTTIGLLGKGGGPAAELCDHALVIDSQETEHIQEAHLAVIHLILEAVEGA